MGLDTAQIGTFRAAVSGPAVVLRIRRGQPVVERAIDVAAVRVLARHRGDERVGAGGQHQGVVVMRRAVGDADPFGVAVDPGDRVAETQVDQRVAGVVVTGESEQSAVPGADV